MIAIPSRIAAIFILFSFSVPTYSQTSQLWGAAGEKWTPQSRLPDFSFAGYRRAEEPFRIPRESISVASFGAKGDGKTDDTRAFKEAIAGGAGKVILVPAGRYMLSDVLEIRASNLVLRGAGQDKTVLLFTKGLEELRPRPVKNDSGTPTSNWSWGGGLIMIGTQGNRRDAPGDSAPINAAAARGANVISVEGGRFKVGDEVVVSVQDDAEQSLLKYLYRGREGNITGLKDWRCRQIFRVRTVSGKTLTLDRGLRFELRPEWRPALSPFKPAVTDVGIESLAFEFPATRYAGHFKEVGFNPIAINSSAANCWLKDLRVWNGDNGPFVNGAFCTLEGIHLGADPQRYASNGVSGHHGITFEAQDCLCTHFTVDTQFVHDLTVQSAMGCAFSSGRALNLAMDHHCWASYENLFTDIDGGEGKRLWTSGGGGNRGSHTAAGATYWNIRTKQPAAWSRNFGPDMVNLVGLSMREYPPLEMTGRWIEPIAPGPVQPANLYSAMLKKRLAK